MRISADRLRGRKLFLWGRGAGGRRWQTFLSQPGRAYIELQAGLARTQAEHVPMPAGADWAWLEAYGLMEAEPAVAHGGDWASAQQAVESRLERLVPRAELEADLYLAACRMRPSLLPLAVECGRALIQAGRHAEWLALVDELPEAVRLAGRVRLLEGQAALATRAFGRVKRVLDGATAVDDLREGERSLSNLWFQYHERRLSVEESIPVDDALRARVRREFPVPAQLDFRMSADPPVSS